MINSSNFEKVLIALGFTKTKNQYMYKFPEHDCCLKADMKKKEFIYPEAQGLNIVERTVCNFQNENFVVFECVFKLLKCGYKPHHITLEPKWIVGHGQSGGRADIQIKDNQQRSFLLIECKTQGEEFNKYWKKTELDGGQLFSYAQQAKETQYLCMYTSDFQDGAVLYQSHIVSLLDNDSYLKSLQKPLAYRDATDATSLYSVWNNTYDREYATKGIFEKGIAPFQVGKNTYTASDLTVVGNEDIQKKYHEFATIMRQHSVAGRENAFDKLVNLFLAKIVDEIINPDQLQFYWRGLAFDDYFSLHDRIQKLYKEGMERFLHEDVTYIDNETIENAFGLFQNDPDETKDTILNYIRQLKFFTNNNFAFLDVHNEHLFYQNSEVLRNVVKMLQDIKLNTEEPNQFLGDLFEGFLDQGVKQSEGQFFTPLPIVKFLVSSLPVEEMLSSMPHPPKVLDFACGAGHFLNEYATQIRSFVDTNNLPEYYKNIFGIEKEYRLSKVAKVSSFMYGQDGINIIYGDALSNKTTIKEGSVHILVANPPYSVKGFLATLTPEERKKYKVFESIGNNGIMTSSSIETFFIERADQLLASGGVAAIILPLTILSNSAAPYITAREILLQHFDIIAIAEFGGQTFGKTGTNTVTLFIRKKKENPSLAKHYHNRVEAWFSGDFSKDNIYGDSHLWKAYSAHIGIDPEVYKSLLNEKLNNELFEVELFFEYRAAFLSSTSWKNRCRQKTFQKLAPVEQEQEMNAKLYRYITDIEKEKMYYYILAASNAGPVIVIRPPAKQSEQKAYLGYEWSGAKGSEGIKYLGVDMVDEENVLMKNKGINSSKTPLFNPADLYDETKINTIIRNGFNGKEIPCDHPYVSRHTLTDMLNFSKVTFDKSLSLIGTPVITIESQYDQVPIKDLVTTIGGLWTGKKPPFTTVGVIRNTNFTMQGKLDTRDVAMIQVEKSAFEKRMLIPGDIIIEKSGGSETQAVGRVVLFELDGDYSFSNFTACLRLTDSRILPAYLHIIMNAIYHNGLTFPFQTGSSGLKNLKLNDYLQTKIPLPPKTIQNKVIAECGKIDAEYQKTRMNIGHYKEKIDEVLRATGVTSPGGMHL